MDNERPDRLAFKPYGFVPLIPVRRFPVPGHQALLPDRLNGVLTLEMEALQPLHIGTGAAPVALEGRLLKPFVRAGQQLLIPGSSVKGVVRSIAEAVSPSCPPALPYGRHSDELPVSGIQPCDGGPSGLDLCPACGLFGFVNRSNHYRGRVGCGDFVAAPGTRTDHLTLRQLQSPHPDKSHLYLDRRGKLRGRKFYYHGRFVDRVAAQGRLVYEVVPVGTTFMGEIRFMNLTDTELGLLAFSLGLDGSFAPKIGQGKPAYLGSIRFRFVSGVVREGFKPVSDVGSRLTRLAAEHGQSGPPVDAAIAALRKILNAEQPGGPVWDPETRGY